MKKRARFENFDIFQREMTQHVSLADHEILLSFNNDDDAIAFQDWLLTEGVVVFQKYLDEKEKGNE